MSKSLGDKHVIGLFEGEANIRKKIKSAVTDTGEAEEKMSAGVENLFTLLKASGYLAEHDSLLKEYEAGNRKYATLKESVGDAMVALTSSFINRRNEIMSEKEGVEKLVLRLSEQARELAAQTIKEVKQLTGIRSY